MCLYPRLIRNRKYVSNKKNGGNPPPLNDERINAVPVGCGRCMECLKQKSREWAVRMHEEVRHDKRGKFVTMSFSDESLVKLQNDIYRKQGYELENATATLAVRRFLERWRKKYGKSVKHWLITELGQKKTERIHIHGIIWTSESIDTIEEKWGYGNVWVGEYVNEKTVNYIVKYLSKIDLKHKNYIPKILTSAGIGSGYLDRIDSKNNKYNGKKTKEYYITRSGMKLALPKYYRNKIYTEEEREKLWINKLDEEVRWVNGVKIDISNGDEVYKKRREEARIKNKRFNYGELTNWEDKKYEEQQRSLLKLKREQKVYKENLTRSD